MESNWRWNGWVMAGGVYEVDLAARLLEEIAGRPYLMRMTTGTPAGLYATFWDTSIGPFSPLLLIANPDPGFPYGVPVDQTRFEFT